MSSPIGDIDRSLWELREDNEKYKIYDLSVGPRTVMSQTLMNPFQQTRGHSHPHAEVLVVERGWGVLLTGYKDDPTVTPLAAADIILIDPGEWHRVTTENQPLVFTCFFEGSRSRSTY